MNKIIAVIKPFDAQQFVGVFNEQGERICLYNIPLERLQDMIPEYADAYGVTEVDIAGPEKFTAKVKEEVEQYVTTKFSERKLTVNLI